MKELDFETNVEELQTDFSFNSNLDSSYENSDEEEDDDNDEDFEEEEDQEDEDEEDCEIDIYVIDEEGDPVESEEVTVFWGSFGGHESDYTDDDGHVRFTPPRHTFSGSFYSDVTIYVRSEKFEYDSVECGNGYTITLSND